MLNATEAYTVLPAKDLARARGYYTDKLGLEPEREMEDGVLYKLPGGSSFFMYETDNAGSAKNTCMCFRTSDLDAAMTDLRAQGVTFEDYDFPGLKTENGVATMEGEKSAWFVDSEGNILCIAQDT
jgi:catechol 2,3-dioxygenase-like lactoylglutathione lyase family enzyme